MNGETSSSETASADGHHPQVVHKYDVEMVKQTCCLHGLDMVCVTVSGIAN